MRHEGQQARATDHCFCCGVELDYASAFPEDSACFPATNFTATGNWGSTIYDGPEPGHLEINICDGCVIAGRERMIVHGERELPNDIRDDIKAYLTAAPRPTTAQQSELARLREACEVACEWLRMAFGARADDDIRISEAQSVLRAALTTPQKETESENGNDSNW